MKNMKALLLQCLAAAVVLTSTAFGQGTATATLIDAYVPLPGGGTAIYDSTGLPRYYKRMDGMGTVIAISPTAASNTATITKVSETNDNVVTITANNSFIVGQSVLMSGLTSATWLNGYYVTILETSSTIVVYQDPTLHGSLCQCSYGPSPDTGTASFNFSTTTSRTASYGEDYDTNYSGVNPLPDYGFGEISQEPGTAGGIGAGYGGLYVTPNRDYSAEQGRWLSPDPVIGDNAYIYVSDQPIVNTDPSGLQDCGDDCLIFTGPDGGGLGFGFDFGDWGDFGGGWGSWGWGWFGGSWSQGPGGRKIKSLFSSIATGITKPSAYSASLPYVDLSPNRPRTYGIVALGAAPPVMLWNAGVNVYDNVTDPNASGWKAGMFLARMWMGGAGGGLSAGTTPGGILGNEGVQGSLGLTEDLFDTPFYRKIPEKEFTFTKVREASLREKGRGFGWVSSRAEGSSLAKAKIEDGVTGFSVYEEDLDPFGATSIELRTSDHWEIDKDGSMTMRLTAQEMKALGGRGWENDVFFTFKKPITGVRVIRK
jgi:RHS repeat-associated protein